MVSGFVILGLMVATIAAVPQGARAELTQSATSTSGFNGQTISAGDTVWFQSVIQLHGGVTTNTNVHFTGQLLTFSTSKATWSVKVWSGDVLFSTTATTASTVWENGSNSWLTTVPASYSGDVFVSGFALLVNSTASANDISKASVTWSGTFGTSEKCVDLNWKWAAAVYSTFPNTQLHSSANSKIGVKSVDDTKLDSKYPNSDHAGTPENYKADLVAGARGGGGSNFTGSYSGTVAVKQGQGC